MISETADEIESVLSYIQKVKKGLKMLIGKIKTNF